MGQSCHGRTYSCDLSALPGRDRTPAPSLEPNNLCHGDRTVSQTTIVFFGCWDDAGHFLWNQHKQWVADYEIKEWRLPTAKDLDASELFLPPEKVGTGALTYLPAPNLTVLAWWGNNPWDQRGKVNNAVITNGDTGETAIWQLFARYFPELEKQLKRPAMIEKSE